MGLVDPNVCWMNKLMNEEVWVPFLEFSRAGDSELSLGDGILPWFVPGG